MPFFQRLIERANRRFDRENIAGVSLGALAPPTDKTQTLASIASQLNIASDAPGEREYLMRWPPLLQETVRFVLQSAVETSQRAGNDRDKRPVTMAWTPGYDYNVSVWESRSTADSAGAVTLLLSSPYPRSDYGNGS